MLWFRLPRDEPEAVASDMTPGPNRTLVQDTYLPVVVNGRHVLVPLQGDALAASGLDYLLDSVGFGATDGSDESSPAEHPDMSLLDRRSVLKGGMVAVAMPGLGLADLQYLTTAFTDLQPCPDLFPAQYFRDRLAGCKEEDGRLGPKHTLPVVLGLLGALEQATRDADANLRRTLLAVGAEAAEFAGWLYRDVHRPETAGFWYDRAMEWAQEADDPAMQGYVLLKKSQMAYDERDAVRVHALAEAAANDRWRLPRRVRAEVAQQVALGAAMTGEPLSGVRRQLDDAHALLADSDDDEPGQLGAAFTQDTLLLRNAVTLTEAGKPGKAAELFDDVLAAGNISERDGGLFSARRAAALALSGEPDEAARVGRESASVARAMRSTRTEHVLRDVLRTLVRWRGRTAVREFHEALAKT